MKNDNDVLEQNVSSLLETGGEPPRISDAGRARIRASLVDQFGAEPAHRSFRRPLVAGFVGVLAAAAIALLVLHGRAREVARPVDGALADGSTFVTAPGGKLTVLGPRHVRVEGEALLDVVPGKGTFTVDTARGTIEVLGTRFYVDGEAERTTAAVVRGEVKLVSDLGSVLLHAGEQGIAERGRAPVRGPAPRLSQLVAWSREARPATQVAPMHHGTLFARDPGLRSHPPWGHEYPLPIAKLGVDVVVQDRVARVALDQTFHNDAPETLEGVYRFAIPPDAALQRLAMYVDGRLEESAVVERMQARRIYEELVYRRVDPALLEWAGNGRLSLRIYPIPAQSDKRVVLAYTQSLPELYDDWTLTVPLPEVDRPVGELDATVRVAGCASCELSSTSHAITVEKKGDDAIVHVHQTAAKTGDSLVLRVRDPRHAPVVATHADGGDRYLMVRAPVELDRTARAYHPRTWILLDDVSASRSPLELRAQQDLVDAFLRELDENDKVGVVAFDVEARTKLAPTRVLDVDRKVVREALKGEGGVGATDFSVGLDEALKQLAGTAGDDARIVYLGDGVITAGPRELDALRGKLEGKAQFVGVGVGDAPDTQTLGALAAATGGYTTTIDLADDVSWRAFDLVAALHTTRVTNLGARLVDASGQLVPSTAYLGSPQLADGEELDLVAKLAGSGTPAAVELDGTADGKPWHRRVALASAHDGGYLPRLWAQRHIAARLLAKQEPAPPGQTREQRDEQIRQEVVALGKRYFLLSRHTSLLVLENDAMYAQYGVTKGRGDTWAAYPLPATIPVTQSAPPTAQIATGSDEVVRAPLQVFYDPSIYYGQGWGRRGGWAADDTLALGNDEGIALTRAEAIREAQIAGVLGNLNKAGDGFADLQSATQPSSSSTGIEQRLDTLNARDEDSEHAASGPMPAVTDGPVPTAAATPVPATTEAQQERWHGGGGYLDESKHLGLGPLMVQRFLSPSDPAFDDLSGFVPALVPDAADAWRVHLGAPESHAIDDAARAQLARARARLAAGIYRWGDRELALDAARHLGWRTTSHDGVAETASFDGATLVRRYAELDLDVTRAIDSDDVALAFAYLPLWIAEPAHYARYFDVTARGPHEVALARGKQVELVLTFDGEDRLVAIHDGKGGELVAVTWGANGPTAARAGGEAIAVGFTAEPVADAGAWAHGAARPGVVVELPLHAAATWQTTLAQLAPGTAEWRRAERQRLASLAATGDRGNLFEAFEQLHAHGGVELGDLVLGSGGLTAAPTDERFAAALAPFAHEPLARYLIASRAWTKTPRAERLAPETRDGLVGALWTLRAMSAQLADKPGKAAVDTMLQIPERASELRLVAAAILSRGYDLPHGELVRAWHAVQTGRYVNVARAQAAQALMSRGDYEAAADELAQLAAQLDLAAPPGRMDSAAAVFQASRRGAAGWQLVWATWRQRVLAGDSYAHVMSIVPLAQRPGELPEVLARAAQLAGDDSRRALEVAQVAVAYGQGAWAQTIVKPLLARHPSRELYQLDAQLELAQGRTAEALAALESAQDAGADERVPLQTMRGELAEILQLARQLALSSSGAERQRAVERAEKWAKRWREVDPGNTEIDRTLGELLLAVGDRAGAWRQLSSTIERDPWSGAGYTTVAEAFERQGNVADALPFWHQAVIIDQTNPTPRLREAQALIALGRTAEGDAELREITSRQWHEAWTNVVYQAKVLLERSKSSR